MSKHFNYDYKIVLHEQLGKKFRRELKELEAERMRQSQLDIAQEMIVDYFDVLESSLSDIILVCDNRVQIIRNGSMIVQFKMFDNFVKFTRFQHAIEVEIGAFDIETKIVEARIISNIIPGDKRCVVKRIGKVHDGSHFDDKSINYYMHEIFGPLNLMD